MCCLANCSYYRQEKNGVHLVSRSLVSLSDIAAGISALICGILEISGLC